jgi:hypothetical protein
LTGRLHQKSCGLCRPEATIDKHGLPANIETIKAAVLLRRL